MLTVNKNKPKDGDFWANMPIDDLAFGNAMDCDFTLRGRKINPFLDLISVMLYGNATRIR